ncbi:hypothetical protein [Streptomyces zingiberis]|uniref:Uncharacterized protein n=1 Tax=Streptomyces zingiberis TaxID=2053010 RepID=A0ABX1BVD1_9ACTN|nr:hypothetical protein [Streptomyces zingiberis]NJQ01679.1 hypothetical protein [Streptomyces zingiberis]
MTTSAAHPPIYQQLLNEHGDVVADARNTAEEIRREAAEALDWHGPGIQRQRRLREQRG